MELKRATGDHTYLFISLFTGSPTEQGKTQQIVTLVETAHASFTGGPLFTASVSLMLHLMLFSVWLISAAGDGGVSCSDACIDNVEEGKA